MNNNLLDNKRGLIVGVANERSLAWGIAESIFKSESSLAFLHIKIVHLKKEIIPLADKVRLNFFL